jgi:DNA-binding transcriptional LysR family regulator
MYDITLQQIEYFLKVAETQSFSDAANMLFVSQPAVSKWIDRLEKTLGVKLFCRTRNGVILTEEGKYLNSEWLPLYNRICVTASSVQLIHRSDERVLRIGCINSLDCQETLDRILADYRNKYPDTVLVTELYDHTEIRQRLMTGYIDAAVTSSFT